MRQEKIYMYLGDNGVFTTPVHLEGLPSTMQVRLVADNGKILKNVNSGETRKIICVKEDEVANWEEIAEDNLN